MESESNAPNQEPKQPESNASTAPNPLTIDSTQSVRFFYNNVDSVNGRENGLLIENEKLYNQINILETEIQDLKNKQFENEKQPYMDLLKKQRDIMIQLTATLNARDKEIKNLKQVILMKEIDLKEITPIDTSDGDSSHSELLKENIKLKDEIQMLKSELALRNEECHRLQKLMEIHQDKFANQIRKVKNSLSLRDEQYQELQQQNIDYQRFLETYQDKSENANELKDENITLKDENILLKNEIKITQNQLKEI